jgi:hypothetical protein
MMNHNGSVAVLAITRSVLDCEMNGVNKNLLGSGISPIGIQASGGGTLQNQYLWPKRFL